MTTPINPGIVATVQWLQSNGFHTTDSGDGETHAHECDQPVPYVHILADPSSMVAEADRLVRLLKERGVEVGPMNEDNTVPTVEAAYSPTQGLAHISLWNVRL